MSPAPSAKAVVGSAPDFGLLYAEFAEFVWRSLRRLGVPDSDVADACQEAFVVVHRKLPDFAGRSSLKTWVFGICLRVASDWRKRAHLRRETGLEQAPERRTSSQESPSEAIALRQARAQLDRLLDELDPDKRTVFVLFELEQLPMTEVAELVGCPAQTAYARLYAARRQLESLIAAQQAPTQVQP